MSNPTPPPFSLPGDDATDDPTTVDDDGDRALDPDANDDLVDSAAADRLAADGDSEESGE